MRTKLWNGFRFALLGLRTAWVEELNFKIEVLCAILVFFFGWRLGLSPTEYLFIVVAVTSVLTTEALNTALEELCDKFSPTRDEHIAKIKDLAAAAVLLSALGALVVGLIIFVPRI